MAGMELPNYLKGKNISDEEVAEVIEAKEIKETKDNLPKK
jgi:hypothetical protein